MPPPAEGLHAALKKRLAQLQQQLSPGPAAPWPAAALRASAALTPPLTPAAAAQRPAAAAAAAVGEEEGEELACCPRLAALWAAVDAL